MLEKNIVLFVNSVPKNGIEKILKLLPNIELAIIGGPYKKDWIQRTKELGVKHFILVNYNKPKSITKALFPIKDRLLAITCRSDKNIPDFAKIIPHVPYLKTPTTESLHWALDKIAMRERFEMYAPEITPKFLFVNNSEESTIKNIEKIIKYPLVVKPVHLFSSLLVSQCCDGDALKKQLNLVFRKIKKVYKHNKIKKSPTVLVEEKMHGDKYSVDAYVDSRGNITFCPIIYIRTGYDIGIEDFFEYETTNRFTLSKSEIKKCLEAATKSVHALALRNTSAHIELIKNKDGWKIIEVGARIGGFRQKMYKLCYNIEHAANDVRIHISQKLVIPKKRLKYASAFMFYSQTEGQLVKVKGIKKVKELSSFLDLKVQMKIGNMCNFAKNGGRRVLTIWLVNKDLKQLEIDIEEMESLVKVVVE